MKPRSVHLLVLCLLCLAPSGIGAFLVASGLNAHGDLSGLDVAIGMGLLAASLLYAAISSVLVWKLGSTRGRVLTVHAGIFCSVTAIYGVPRLYYLVAR